MKNLVALAIAALLLTNAAAAEPPAPSGLCAGEDGALVCADVAGHALWRQETDGAWSRLAGGAQGYRDGAADKAAFASPWGAAPFGGGFAVTDSDNHAVRLVADGMVRTAAGTGKPGRADGVGTRAAFERPTGIVAGEDGCVYIADTGNHAIRRLAPDGRVTTVVGGTEGCADGTADEARLREPTGLSYAEGALWIADSGNHRICRFADGRLETVAGSDLGEEGDRNGAALAARFSNPQGVLAAEDAVYIADTGNGAVRVLRDGRVSTLAGVGSLGDGLYPVAPRGLALRDGMLLVGDVFARVLFPVERVPSAFPDIPAGAWYEGAAAELAARGILYGEDDGRFHPDAPVRRGMAVTLLARAETAARPSTVIGGSAAFADVPVGAYYEKPANWAAAQGIARGVEGRFEPARAVTRAELATMAYRSAAWAGLDTAAGSPETALAAFPDGGVAQPWARPALAWALDAGLLTGGANGALRPNAPLTRAEAAAFLSRYLAWAEG